MEFTTYQITLITVAIIAAIGAFVTAIISAIATIITNARTRKNEYKVSILKVLLEAAYKEYEFRTKTEIENSKFSSTPPKIKSFTEYIIFYKEMAEIFSKETVTESDIITSLEKNKKLIDAYYINRETQRPEYHKTS